MNCLFVPYEESLELKELGFDEPCFALWFTENKQLVQQMFNDTRAYDKDLFVLAPTFSQAFKWFREKYNIDGLVQIEPLNIKYGYVVYQRKINSFVESKRDFNTYEEAELACFYKLIQIVKVKQ